MRKFTHENDLQSRREQKKGLHNPQYSICKFCNKEFNNRNNIYCSIECKNEYNLNIIEVKYE